MKNPVRFGQFRWRDLLVFLAMAMPAILADNLRIAGGAIYFLCVLMALLSLGQGMSRKTVRDALLFSGIVLIYCGLSYLQLLPRGWTVLHQKGAILRQALPLIGFCVMLVAFHRFWSRVLTSKIDDKVLLWLLVALLVVGPLADLAVGGAPLSRVAGTLRNSSLIFLVVTSHIAYRRRGLMLILMPLVYIAAAVLSTYSQTRGFYLLAALLLWTYAAKVNFSRIVTIAITTAIIVSAAVALLTFSGIDYARLWHTDYNTAWRLIFWRDVFHSTLLTHGIGVGFGTEALVNIYPEMPRPVFIHNPANNPDFIMIGTHNAFTDALFRCGVIGFVTFCWIFLSSARIMRRFYTPALAIAFCSAFLCAFVNVALQSPLYSVGIAFALSYCRAFPFRTVPAVRGRTAPTLVAPALPGKF